jgi:prepilin-type processing-associated H-X9-DG protein
MKPLSKHLPGKVFLSRRLHTCDLSKLPFVGGASSQTHYPPRHNKRLNGLFYDSHVQAMRPADLTLKNFREPGSLPVEAAYPGE